MFHPDIPDSGGNLGYCRQAGKKWPDFGRKFWSIFAAGYCARDPPETINIEKR